MLERLEAGKIVPVIDKRYRFSETAEALRYLGEGHARGKVVITVEHDSKTQNQVVGDVAPLRSATRLNPTVGRFLAKHNKKLNSSL